jgi:FAD/FMN-containing dehydrogenase
MNKIASTLTKALPLTPILNISKNTQPPMTPQSPLDPLLTQKNEIKHSITITKGNISGQYKRLRSFCTYYQRRYFSTTRKTTETFRANYSYSKVTETH